MTDTLDSQMNIQYGVATHTITAGFYLKNPGGSSTPFSATQRGDASQYFDPSASGYIPIAEVGAYTAQQQDEAVCTIAGIFLTDDVFDTFIPPPELDAVTNLATGGNSFSVDSSGTMVLWGYSLACENTCGESEVSITFSPSDSNVQTSWSYLGDQQINLDYTINAGAIAGTHTVCITTPFPPESCSTFTVGDGTPVITAISPSTWTAGASVPFTITGSNFGSITPSNANTALTISPSVATFSVQSWADNLIQAIAVVNQSASGSASLFVTSTGFGSGFQSGGGSQPSQGGGNNGVQIVKVQPLIYSGGSGTCGSSGSNVTNTSQIIAVGQYVSLCASYTLPPGVTVNNQAWSVAGTSANPPSAIAGYSASTAGARVNPLTATSGQSIAFYFVVAANAQPVEYTAKLSNGVSVQAQVSYNNVAGFSGPSMSATQPNLFTVNMYTGCPGYAAVPYMIFGNTVGPVQGCPGFGTAKGTPGILFSNTTSGAPTAGTFSFAQVITADSRSYSYPNQSPPLTCHSTVGLDTNYPYTGTPAAGEASDAPSLPLPSIYSSAQRTFNATMYMLWTSSTANSIPVPVVYVSWGFTEDASQAGGKWSSPTGFGGPYNVATPSNGSYPTWNGISIETCP